MLMELDIFSEGKEYISASRAAEKIGYTSDYIGQLCRAKKIPAKLISRTWYVDFSLLLDYKNTQHIGKGKKIETSADQGRTLGTNTQGPTFVAVPRSLNNLAFSYEK